ncbi:MAG: glycoside hydrolase family 13 protein [Blastopirellula sp.]|nr:glycoside hydrolase family 13 protein [Blastopirellula sp.]
MLISPLLRQHVTFLLLTCGLTATALAQTTPPTAAPVLKTKSTKSRVPEWVSDAVFYQLFPERFRNGDSSNDPDRKSLEDPNWVPETWQLTPWTADWYSRADWERQSGPNFYENGVFNRRCGGDLQGVLDQLDYLKKLGVNCIYFNPVFYARSLHKYDGNSFHHIDPHFGPDPAGDFALMASETPDPKSWQWTAADKLFLKLIAEAHRREIRVIIDGVFNHTGRDFFAFEDIRKQGGSSPYANWYVIQAHDNPATPENELKYQCWWGVETLPEFANNEDGSDLHPEPKAYVFQITRRWMDPNGDGNSNDGIDGWRLDVANEVPNQFWRQWNQLVRELNPEAYTVAEIWTDAARYLEDCGFSSTMNYHGFSFPCKAMLVDGRISGQKFAETISARLASHTPDVRPALLNLLESHDTDRLASMVVNAKFNRPYIDAERADYDRGERVSPRHFPEYDVSRPNADEQRIVRLATLFQMTFVGAPMLYYGTEAGMDGADDPDDRMPMIWPDISYEPRTHTPRGKTTTPQPIAFNQEMFDWFSQATELRAKSEALRRGNFRIVYADPVRPVIAFVRETNEEQILVVVNRSPDKVALELAADAIHSAGARRLNLLLTNDKQLQPEHRLNRQAVQLEMPGTCAAVWKVSR